MGHISCLVLLLALPESPLLFLIESCLTGRLAIASYQTLSLDDWLLKAGSVHAVLCAVLLFLGGINAFFEKAFMYFRVSAVTMFVSRR